MRTEKGISHSFSYTRSSSFADLMFTARVRSSVLRTGTVESMMKPHSVGRSASGAGSGRSAKPKLFSWT